VDIGGSDDVVVSGFFEKEAFDLTRTYRWTGTCGSVYFPGLRPGGDLLLTLSAGKRPAPAEVKVSLSGRELGSVVVAGPSFETFRLPLPSALPDHPVLRLDVRSWRAPNDTRDLGVMVDRLEVHE
jgi:hypothetical protein